MTAPRCRIDRSPHGSLWVWYRRLDRRNGYLAWGPVGTPFNRRRPLHWAVALYVPPRGGRPMRLPFVSRRRYRRALDNLADHCADEIVMAAERGRREGRAEVDADAHRDWEAEANSLRRAIRTHRARNPVPAAVDEDLYVHLGEDDR